jgi:FkbM family methyltransferase
MKSKSQNFLIKVANKINPNHKFISERELFSMKWKLDNGDNSLSINYNLNSESIVFDVGGYRGDWCNEIVLKYDCYIHVFEPVKLYAQLIKDRFILNDKVKVNDFGLSDKTIETVFCVSEESSSVFKLQNKSYLNEAVILRDIYEYISKNSIVTIDLMKINIEGGEFSLLNRIIDTGLISKIDNIKVQFHSFVKNAESQRIMIQNKLRKTHQITYNYPFVWENWERKK